MWCPVSVAWSTWGVVWCAVDTISGTAVKQPAAFVPSHIEIPLRRISQVELHLTHAWNSVRSRSAVADRHTPDSHYTTLTRHRARLRQQQHQPTMAAAALRVACAASRRAGLVAGRRLPTTAATAWRTRAPTQLAVASHRHDGTLPATLSLHRAFGAGAGASNAFSLPAETLEIKDQAGAFFMSELNPLLATMDETDAWPAAAWQKIADQGYLGLTIPEEYGGAGLDFLTGGAIAEELAYANHSLSIAHAAHDNLCANNIYLNGTEEQRRKYLPGLCDGSLIGALGMSEPGAGSDAIGSMATRAVRKDDNTYVLNGTKMWISNAPIADVVLVYAKTSPDPKNPNAGVSAFIVDADAPGFQVGKKNDKMGFRGAPQSELIFEDCEVPAANLLGKENMGVAVMMSGLDLERTWVAAGAIGVGQRCLDLSLEWARERKQFGRPIGTFQMIQDKLATMYTQLEAARLLTYRALAVCNGVEAGGAGRGEVHKLSAAAFMAAAQAGSMCADEGVQIWGGMGYMLSSEINKLYRSVKVGEIAGGSIEMRKLIIAGELLKGT